MCCNSGGRKFYPCTELSSRYGWLLLGRGIRGISHLRENPSDIWLLPVVAVLTIVIALPVKAYAFLTMNKHGWLTRNANQIGGDGQTAASLLK